MSSERRERERQRGETDRQTDRDRERDKQTEREGGRVERRGGGGVPAIFVAMCAIGQSDPFS